MAGNVRFILGRAGTGKSRIIQDRILELLRDDPLGPPVYLLVPAQVNFVHERFYALAAGLEGYARLRVVSFENLGEDVIAECGGEAMTRVTAVGRQMLLGHLLRVHADRLAFFRPVAHQLGLVSELDRTFAELERAGRSSSELYEALPQMLVEEAAPEYAALVEKTRDLALLGDAYRKALGDDRLDATRRLEHVLSNLEHCRTLRQAHLFVDGFFRFSAFERKMLVKLAAVVREVRVALSLDPDLLDRTVHESDLFFPTASTYRLLLAELEKAEITPQPPQHLESPRRFRSPALNLIERDWTSPRASVAPGVDASAVQLIEAPDPRAEADAAARQVKAWANEGFRLRDVAVLCRDLSAYQPLLEASFSEHEIPFFTDRRRAAAHHPLVRFVRSVLQVSLQRWPHHQVMDLCKCGLAGMELDDADALENYVLEHRIRGRRAWTSPEPWQYHLNPADAAQEGDAGVPPIDEPAAVIDQLRRRLAAGIGPLADALGGDPRPVREHLGALWACMERFEVRRRLSEQVDEARAAGRLEEAAEHEQAWDELLGLFDQVIELLGVEELAGEDFVDTLEYGLDLLDLAIVPPAADEVVIGDVERSRLLNCRAAIVLGMNDGQFPRSHTDPTVLSDEERRLLRKNHVDVEPEGSSRQYAERFLAYRALTIPSERLTLLRSASDDEGRPATESPYWEHVRKLLGLEPRRLRRPCPEDPTAVGTPRQLASVLMNWCRAGGSDGAAAQSLYQFLADHHDLDGPLGVARRLSWRALAYENRAALSEETAQRLFGRGLYTSVSRLEKFAACPFSHYAAHVLKLRVRDDEESVTPRDIGTLYHGVLEQLVRRCIHEKLRFTDPASIQPDQIQQITREVGEQLRGRIMLSSARNEYVLKRVETMLHGIISGQQEALRRGKLVPLRTELRFGEGDAELPPFELETPRGRRVRLYGQIDRVDYDPESGFTAVIDYKHSGRELKLDEVTYGLSLQLLLYLLVVQKNGASLTQQAPKPAAALYVRLLRGLQTGKHPEDGLGPDTPAFDLRHKPRGVMSMDGLRLLDEEYYRELPGGYSQAYSVCLTRGGVPSRSAGNDLVLQEDLEALLSLVEKQVRELADRLMDGCIEVRPYKMGDATPCTYCDFRSLCRFDPAQDDYLSMPPKNRAQVLEELRGALFDSAEAQDDAEVEE